MPAYVVVRFLNYVFGYLRTIIRKHGGDLKELLTKKK